MGVFLIVVAVFLAINLYFLPASIANVRHHQYRTSIAMINLLLGWSVLGWIAALVWALMPGERAA